MQTTSKGSLGRAIQNFVADKPKLSRHFERFDKPEEDIWVYSALAREVFIGNEIKDEQS